MNMTAKEIKYVTEKCVNPSCVLPSMKCNKCHYNQRKNPWAKPFKGDVAATYKAARRWLCIGGK